MLYQMALLGLGAGALILRYLYSDDPPPNHSPSDSPHGPLASPEVKDLKGELETKETFTQMPWNIEKLMSKHLEMELELKSAQIKKNASRNIYAISEDSKHVIREDIAPGVLKSKLHENNLKAKSVAQVSHPSTQNKASDTSLFNNPTTSSSQPSPFSSKLNPSPSQTTPSFSSNPTPSSSSSTPSPSPSSQKNFKSCLSSNDQQSKNIYVLVHDSSSPTYVIPEDIKEVIKRNDAPRVLKSPVSPQTYRDFFAALLYAEDFYIEKWSNFQLLGVNLVLEQAVIHNNSNKKKNVNKSDVKEEKKTFVAFELDAVRERRPFLLSRDFVFVRRSGSTREPFQGLIYRVVKSNRVLVEFGDDFHSQHSSARKYDVSFSFNRVSLKRCHHAIAAASDYLLQNVLFPPHDCISRNNNSFLTSPSPIFASQELDSEQKSTVRQILSHKGPSPYLIQGHMSVTGTGQLSRTGLVIREAVVQIYRTFPNCRILISAPINSTCDVLMRNLKMEIPETNMFRANAAFREVDEVPDDILPSCLQKGDCFACPSLQELRNFKVILSTFVSSFRLANEGLKPGHFSHIFLVDASSAIEPEVMVTLANLASSNTSLVVTGAPNNHPHWVRSDIARSNGLMVSYFERLTKTNSFKQI